MKVFILERPWSAQEPLALQQGNQALSPYISLQLLLKGGFSSCVVDLDSFSAYTASYSGPSGPFSKGTTSPTELT